MKLPTLTLGSLSILAELLRSSCNFKMPPKTNTPSKTAPAKTTPRRSSAPNQPNGTPKASQGNSQVKEETTSPKLPPAENPDGEGVVPLEQEDAVPIDQDDHNHTTRELPFRPKSTSTIPFSWGQENTTEITRRMAMASDADVARRMGMDTDENVRWQMENMLRMQEQKEARCREEKAELERRLRELAAHNADLSRQCRMLRRSLDYLCDMHTMERQRNAELVADVISGFR
jgi:hypothetical protein